MKVIARRFCGKECKLSFNDFVLVVTKVVSLIGKNDAGINRCLIRGAEIQWGFLDLILNYSQVAGL